MTKTHTGSVEAFKSGDFGFLGEVWDDRVVFSRAPLRRQYIAIGTVEMPRVEIQAMLGGADDSLMRYAVDPGSKGIVVQAVEWLQKLEARSVWLPFLFSNHAALTDAPVVRQFAGIDADRWAAQS